MGVKILTDSACDLPKDIVAALDIEVLPLYVQLDNQEYKDGVDLEAPKMYQRMREGSYPTTAQVSLARFQEVFERFAEENIEGVYLAFSSELSGTYNSAAIALSAVKENHPDFKFSVVDTKCASMGFGLVVYKAARMAKEGKSAQEIVETAKDFALHMEHIFSVDTFDTLVKGGRVTKVQGFLGSMLKIKPILDVEEGKLIPREKMRGRQKAFKRMVEIVGERGIDLENQVFGISHGDDMEAVNEVKKMLEAQYGIKEFVVSYIGCAIGAHSGPGCLALFFLNEKRDQY